MVRALLHTVIDRDIKASRRSDDQLMEILVGMPSTFCASWNIVEVINTPYLEGDMAGSLYESEIPTGVLNLWKLNDLAERDVHLCRNDVLASICFTRQAQGDFMVCQSSKVTKVT